jgi:hypothetical protein
MAEMLAKLMEDKETPKRGPGRPPKEQAA